MEITNGIWLMDASRATEQMPGFHCYLIHDDQGLTMIDASLPGRGEAILEEIRGLGFSPADLKRIFLTHTDMDHIGSAPELQKQTGCRVYISEEEQKYLTGEYDRLPKKAENFRKAQFVFPETELYPAAVPGYQIISTPGHTKGHVAVLYGDCLFAGDCMSTESGEVGMMPPYFTEDMEMAAQSMRKVSLLDFALWCPCHGMPKRHLEEESLHCCRTA